jgi:ferredoxin
MQWLSMMLLLLLICLPGRGVPSLMSKASFSRKTTVAFSKAVVSRKGSKRSLTHAHITTLRIKPQLYSAASDSDDDQELNERLALIAGNLKLHRVTKENDDGGREEILAFESKSPRYGLEVSQTQVSVANGAGLGLVLTEVASGTAGGRPGCGLVLISDVSGNALQADPVTIQVGDVITAIRTTDRSVHERTTGLNYDGTVEAIGTVKKAAKDGVLVLKLNRLVARAPIRIEIVHAENKVVKTIEALAGQNLRQLLLRKDMTLGICGGEGTCGACLVAVHGGEEHLGTRGDAIGDPITKEEVGKNNNGISWRKACQTIIGADNKAGTVRIQIKTQ